MKETNIQVDLIDFTGAGTSDPQWRAARLLAFTKNTRLNMAPEGFERFLAMPLEELKEELGYIVNTLPSSWEFVDATFVIREVSRACAQQITRTRWSPMEADIFGSYAMQAQRVTDMSAAPCHVPEAVKQGDPHLYDHYTASLRRSLVAYETAIADGMHQEDARGLLPMHMSSNLVVKFNLRSLAELCRKRSSIRVQGEYNEVVRQMRALLIDQWPWVAPFFDMKEELASAILLKLAEEVQERAGLSDPFDEKEARDWKMRIGKAIDLIRV